jgi:hypothetical protein
MNLTAASWSELADQTRAIASSMQDALSRKTLVEIAAGYDRLAKRATLAQMEAELTDERAE